MKKIIALAVLLSCTDLFGAWKLEVFNIKTRELKTYLPDSKLFILPIMIEGHSCGVEVEDKTDHLISRRMYCMKGKYGYGTDASYSRKVKASSKASLVIYGEDEKGRKLTKYALVLKWD